MADTSGVKRKSWLKRILIGGAVLVVVLVIAAYLLVPVIAASKAPGIIEEAAAKSIKGSVKVKSVSVGWGGPVIAKDVELLDPEGKRVAVLQLESSLGIWKAISGLSDLGTTKLSGRIDVVRTTDASGKTTTNLERAIESKGPASASSGGGGGSKGNGQIPAMSGTVEVTGIDATFEDRTPAGVTGQAAMKALKGTVTFSTGGAGSADAKLDAGFGEKLDGPATGSLSIKGGGKGFVSNGTLAVEKTDLDVTVAAKGAPVNLIDALAGQKGVLAGALGATADATVTAKGPMNALNADVVVQAPNAAADLGVKSEAGRLRATRKGTLSVKSLAFAERVPGVAAALKDSGVTITGWPGVSVEVKSLDLPAGGEGASWAGAKVEVSAFTTGNVTGTIARPGADGKPGAPEALVVKPITLGIVAPDLVKGIELIASTEATIGGQSAGALDLNAQLTEIIGPDGKLLAAAGGVPGKIVGTLDAKAVSTSLLAPLAAGSGVPLDLSVDVGPTVDLSVNATTKGDGTAGAGSIPPTTITLNLRSANVAMAGSLAYDSTGLGLAGDRQPLELTVQRSSPLVQRLLSSGAKQGEKTPTASGNGTVQLSVKSLRLPVSGKKFDASLASVTAEATVSDLVVQMNDGSAHPASFGAQRVQVSLQALARSVSSLTAGGQLLLDGRPAQLGADVKIGGLLEKQDVAPLGALGTRRLSGTVALTGVPGASVQALAVGSGSDDLKRVVAELVGSSVDVRVNLGEKTNQATQPLTVTLTGPALNAAVGCELKTDALEVTKVDGNASLTDALAQAVLQLAGQKGEAVAGARLRSPTSLTIKLEQPVTVPLKAETVTPDWTRAKGILGLSAGLANPAIVDGLKVDGRSLSAGVANCSLTASVPLSIMDSAAAKQTPGVAGLKLAGTMDLVGNDERDILARVRADGGSSSDGTDPRINLSLTDVATARLDEIAGQGGLIPGLLGDKATVVASVQRSSAAGAGAKTLEPQTEIGVDIQSPQLTLSKGRFLLTDKSYAAAAPFSVSLNASPTVIERLLGSKPGEPAAMRVGESVHLTLNVSKLVLSASGEDKAGGPLKPGVFALDAVAATPKLVLVRQPEPGAARGTAPMPTELNDFTATIKSTGDASKSGLSFNASVGSIKSGDQTVKDATVVRGSLDNIADVGGKVRTETAVLNLNAATGKIPTAIIEALMSGNGRLTELLGSELTADIDARDVSKTGTSGFLNIKLKSPNANLAAAGPVSNGVFDTSAPGATPLRIELNQFKFDGGGKVLSLFPVFAQMQRAAGESNKGPALLASRGLKFPIDGDMTKFSGAIDVDIGRIDYEFSQSLGNLLDETIFRGGRGVEQRAVPRFTINIDRGVLRYGSVQEKVVLPVRNLDFQLRGVVDLVNKRLDVVTYVPTLAAAPGLVANLNSTVGGALGKLVPGVVDKITSIPVRVEGPMDNPKTGYSPQIVLDEFKDVLNPANLIKGIGDLLAPKEQPPANTPAPKPATPGRSTSPSNPVAPNTPAGPTGPTGPTTPKKK